MIPLSTYCLQCINSKTTDWILRCYLEIEPAGDQHDQPTAWKWLHIVRSIFYCFIAPSADMHANAGGGVLICLAFCVPRRPIPFVSALHQTYCTLPHATARPDYYGHLPPDVDVEGDG